ncbi:MAG: hypothetical protein IT353_15060 [Gemmatimonadaceae bacterium]|nr:hypothetical protein [Gemmatimonadaceae bacterium]
MHMPEELDREAARERIITEICSRMPPEMAGLLGEALRTRGGLNFGSSDPDVIELIEQLKAVTDEAEPPER